MNAPAFRPPLDPTRPRFTGAAVVGACLLVVATILAYLPALRGGFIWDDEAHVTTPALRSVTGLGRIWTEPGATQQYYPLLHTVFWLEARCWGDRPALYHLANLAFHLLAAGLFLRVLQQLRLPGAGLAAALFLLHPVQVESVAWISEQKNTLSLVGYLAAALLYLRARESPQPGRYLLATGCFLLALLTKTVVATLPAALLVVLWWRNGRLDWRRDLLPLLPWLALGALAGLFTAEVERSLIGAQGEAFALSWLQRSALAGRVIGFYLGQLLWPANLNFIHPRWDPSALGPLAFAPTAAAILFTGLLWQLRHRSRAPLAVWLIFLGSLFPVLGFLNVYPFIYSFVADHFLYLPSLAPIAFAAAGLQWSLARQSILLRLTTCAAPLVLGTLTWRHAHAFRDSTTLYRHTLERNPAAWLAWNNLGRDLLTDPARSADALACLTEAWRLCPTNPEVLNNYGLALAQNGRAAEAVAPLREAIRLRPGFYQAHNNLGIALASVGDAAGAAEAFRHATAHHPTLPNLRENWGRALLLLGRTEEAESHFAHAARLRAAPPRSTQTR